LVDGGGGGGCGGGGGQWVVVVVLVVVVLVVEEVVVEEVEAVVVVVEEEDAVVVEVVAARVEATSHRGSYRLEERCLMRRRGHEGLEGLGRAWKGLVGLGRVGDGRNVLLSTTGSLLRMTGTDPLQIANLVVGNAPWRAATLFADAPFVA
jgi:hypothetical protein